MTGLAAAARQLLVLALAMLASLMLGAVPAAAQSITSFSSAPTSYSGSGQTITFTVTVNSGSRVASSATVTSTVGAVYSCPIADTTNTGVTFTCTGTYTTTAADASTFQIQERVDVRLNSLGTPIIMTSPVLTLPFVAPPRPTITALSPNAGSLAGGETVIITGTNFIGVTSVRFGTGTDFASYTVDSPTQITAISPGRISAGTANVQVIAAGGGSGVSAAAEFTFVAPPTITSFTPTTGPTAGGTVVTITGTNFRQVSAVNFGATPASSFTVNSTTSITATAPAGTGNVRIGVTTPGGTVDSLGLFAFSDAVAPTVTSISPTGGPAAGGTSVTINGTDFTGASAVSFGATPATSFTVVSPTRINAVAPAGTGTVGVRVTTGAGTSANSTANQFTYVPAPTVTSITPANGPVAGGTTVVITGTNFNDVFAIAFGNIGTAQFTVDSPTQITLNTPLAAGPGTVPVRVTTGGGTSAINPAVNFTYEAAAVAPAITTNPPPSVNVTAGNTVSISAAASGTPTPTVQWQVSTDAGATYTNLAGATSTTLSFTAASADSGKRYRAVFSNSGGTAVTTATALSVNTLPVITQQPVGGTVAPGQGIDMSAAATGSPTPTLQWFYSEDNGASFVPLSSASSFTLVSPTPRTVLMKVTFTNAAGSVTSDTVTLVWVKQNQTISFTSTAPTTASVGGATYAVSATATSNLAAAFSVDASASSVCSVAGSTVSFIGIGTCVINANQAGNTAYNAAPQVQQSFAVGQGTNVITFPALSDTPYASAPPALSAMASSGLAISYASNSTGVCTVAGSTISFVAGGTCSITASQAGNANYVAATAVTQTFQVTQAPNAITFPPLADTLFTATPPALSATASSGLAVSYASNSAAVCTVSGGVISFVTTGTCSITATQGGNLTYQAATPVTQTFAVNPGTNTITFPVPSDTPFTSAPPVLSAAASSGLAVSYASTTGGVCTVTSGGTISFVAAGTCSITASQGGNANYAAASPVSQSFAVTPGVNTITFAALPDRALGSGAFALAASASSGLAVSYASTTAATCSVSGSTVTLLAVGTCTITASQAGNGNFAAASPVSQSFQVVKAATSVTLTSSASTVYFGQPVTLTATVSGASPTGTVTFKDGTTVLGSVALTGTSASLTTSSLSSGSHSLTATYDGDASNNPGTSAPVAVTVNARPDPSTDPDVTASTDSQFRQSERFVRGQIDNISGRLDQLHGDGEDRNVMAVRVSQVRPRLASATPYGDLQGQTGGAASSPLGVASALADPSAPLGAVAGGAAATSEAATVAEQEAPRWHVWASGDVTFGKQQPNGQIETRFTSQGLTVGMDGRFGDNLKLGTAIGFAWDNTRFGTNGSNNDATNASLAFYGSWRVAPKLYVDGIVGLGYGTINTTRFSTTGGVFLDGQRRTDQTFGAVILTWEGRIGRIEFAPYLRADGIWVHLSPYTETGSNIWALSFQAADENSFSGVAGARLRFPLNRGGTWLITTKGEYRTRLSGSYNQLLGYADLQGVQGSPYAITGTGVDSSVFTGGIGIEGRMRGATVRINYDASTLTGGNISNRFSGALIIAF